MEIISIIIALIVIGFVIVPVSLRICEEKIWEFVKEHIEKEARYNKMVKDMLKSKR